MTMAAKGAQSQQSHYQNMGNIQNMRMQAQSQLAQLSNYNDQRQSWQKKSINNGSHGQDLDQGGHGQGMFLKTLRLHHRVDSGVCLIIEVIGWDHDWAIIAHDAFGLALLLSMSQGHATRQDAHAVTQFFC